MNCTSTRGRFAPSPTGALHLGNLRTALLAWLFTRVSGGTFVLRIEDIDRARVRLGATRAILADLQWLGVTWDEGPSIGGAYGPYLQSQRLDLYRQHFERLCDLNRVYPCYCSRRDSARAASAPHGLSSEGSSYPQTCRDPLRRSEQLRRHPYRKPCYRFRCDGADTDFFDRFEGALSADFCSTSGDFVVWRADGVPSYQLATAMDDAMMSITEVVRGADLLSSTPRQVALMRALGFVPPTYAHVPLLFGSDGLRLAKRHMANDNSIATQFSSSAEQIVGMLASSCGLVAEGTECSAAELATGFTVERLTTALSRIHRTSRESREEEHRTQEKQRKLPGMPQLNL